MDKTVPFGNFSKKKHNNKSIGYAQEHTVTLERWVSLKTISGMDEGPKAKGIARRRQPVSYLDINR